MPDTFMPPMIVVDHVTKEYRLGEMRAPYSTLRDAGRDLLASAFKQLRRGGQPERRPMLQALNDVSFTIETGETVGIIGRNGAGKSTLLKILGRITHPTRGSVDLYGRVGSLLEVGTGFHQELSGRENIFLSGAILGMRRAEIERCFDAIVDFAEIGRFVDTPVKFYSSGMYMRLAFAVAAHLQPEILLIDEVLAVGDAKFQKRCLGKIEEFKSIGRTVLFVSHNMASIVRICKRVILLEGGRIVADGPADQVTRRYLQSDTGSPAERAWPTSQGAPGDHVAKLRAVRIRDANGKIAPTIDIRRPFEVEVDYWAIQPDMRPTVSIQFVNDEGITVLATNDFNNREWWHAPRRPGLVRCRCQVPGNFLAEGQVFVQASVWTYNPDVVHVDQRDVVSFMVVDRSEGDGVRGEFCGAWPGVVRPMLDWRTEMIADDREPIAAAHA
jgi:homopolymeric O-antigen transport system ATP-binding protein